MGKSILMQNVIGARLDDDPAPIIYVGPTQSNIDSVVEPKMMEMFKGSKSLWDKLAKGQKSTKHHKRVSGVSLRLAWAGSATELASDSAGLGLVDEVDRMDQDVKGEGSPVELTEARTSVYSDGRIGVTSTPTEGATEVEIHKDSGIGHWKVTDAISSPVWKLWQEGSRHEWAVPCVHCREYFVPRLSLLWWPEKAEPQVAEQEARLTCLHCGGQMEDRHKHYMNSHGIMVAPGQRPEPCTRDDGVQIFDHETGVSQFVDFGDFIPRRSSTLSFWASGLMSFSAKKTFGFLAGKYLRAIASGEPERLQGVINTDFGELFRISGDAPEWQAVQRCAQDYLSGELPDEVNFLTAGVDVQKNRLVYVVRGWAAGNTSWQIEHGELWGDTDQYDVWDRLRGVLETEYNGVSVSCMAVDSGYRPEWVYEFCRENKALAKATKGHETLEKPFRASTIDVNFRGKLIKQGLQLWHFNTDIFKSWVHSRIEWPQDRTGAWHLPADIDEDFCRQIVAEQRVVKPSGKTIWLTVARDNHYLDAEALAYLALRILGQRAESIRRPVKDDTRPRPEPKQQDAWVRRDKSPWLKRR